MHKVIAAISRPFPEMAFKYLKYTITNLQWLSQPFTMNPSPCTFYLLHMLQINQNLKFIITNLQFTMAFKPFTLYQRQVARSYTYEENCKCQIVNIKL